MIYFLFVLCLPLFFEQTKNNKFDRYIGELSYPVYISHMFISYLIIVYLIPNIPNNLLPTYLYVIIFTILFALLLNKFVVNKIEKIRTRNIRRIRPPIVIKVI